MGIDGEHWTTGMRATTSIPQNLCKQSGALQINQYPKSDHFLPTGTFQTLSPDDSAAHVFDTTPQVWKATHWVSGDSGECLAGAQGSSATRFLLLLP